MAELGRVLYEAGWSQGCVFGPLTHLVHFHIEDPLNIPKNVVALAREQFEKSKASGVEKPAVAQVVRQMKQKDLWVLATQDCDLVKGTSIEPYVVAIRAFATTNERTLTIADGNSSKFFLLDPDQGLVADATVQIQLEKPVLQEFDPKPVIATDDRKRRFARWLARRAERPALPDYLVQVFVDPFLSGLRRLGEENPRSLDCLAEVREARVRVSGDVPLTVDLIFFTEAGHPIDGGVGLADLIGHIETWLDPKLVSLRWATSSLGEISVQDYLATEQIFLDHYTYEGETKTGLGPPQRV